MRHSLLRFLQMKKNEYYEDMRTFVLTICYHKNLIIKENRDTLQELFIGVITFESIHNNQ